MKRRKTMADFDLSKLKGNVGGIMGSLKSMISPAGGTPNVDPDDALGLKVAQLTTLIKQMTDVQQEQVKNLNKVNELLNGVFHDIQTLREEVHDAREKKVVEAPVVEAVKAAEPEKKAE